MIGDGDFLAAAAISATICEEVPLPRALPRLMRPHDSGENCVQHHLLQGRVDSSPLLRHVVTPRATLICPNVDFSLSLFIASKSTPFCECGAPFIRFASPRHVVNCDPRLHPYLKYAERLRAPARPRAAPASSAHARPPHFRSLLSITHDGVV